MLNEPSVIALNSRTNEVLAMGRDAWKMIGRTPSYIVAVRPLRQGAITDFEVTQIDKRTASVKFTAETIFGEIPIEREVGDNAV